jgi:hypothetical protein
VEPCADSKPAFPNAEIMVPATEWAYWSHGNMSKAPAGGFVETMFKNDHIVGNRKSLAIEPGF